MTARPALATTLLLVSLAVGTAAPALAENDTDDDARNGAAAPDTSPRAGAGGSDAGRASVAADEPLPDGVVATVNGHAIAELSVENVVRQLGAEGEAPDRGRILDELIDLEMLAQEAEKRGLERRPEIASALRLQYTQTMANAYLAAIGDETTFSEEELRAVYDAQAASLGREEYRASHILLETREDAEAVIAALDGGADFAALAKERSIDPAGVNGGELGWFRSGSMVPEFVAAVAAMEPGTVSEVPVKSDFGFHVIRLEERRAASLPDFDSVRPGLTNIALRERLGERVEALRRETAVRR